MKIGIIGSGSVATTLAKGFIRHGYDVMLGTRDATKLADFQTENPGAKVGSVEQTAAFADLAVLSVKGTVAVEALRPAAVALAGKVVIDTNNPIADEAPENGVLRYFTTANDSLGERLQTAYPAIRFVKAFNSVGAGHMINPDFGGEKPTMFIAGNDAAAKTDVKAIITKFGWDTNDMGSITSSRALEPLCQLWCLPGFLHNEWNHALRMMQKG